MDSINRKGLMMVAVEKRKVFPKKSPPEVMSELLDYCQNEGLDEEMACAVLVDTAFSLVQEKKIFLQFVNYWVSRHDQPSKPA